MKNLTLYSLLALATGVVMMIGCKKGDTGPAGAVGPTGPDSVQYSPWIVFNMAAAPGNDSLFVEDFTVNAITQSVLSKGVILGYFGYEDAPGDTTVLPASDAMTEYYFVGGIEVQSYGLDLSQAYFYRYVIIPGNVAVSSVGGSSKTYTVDQLKKMSYKQIIQTLGIPAKGGGSLKLTSPN